MSASIRSPSASTYVLIFKAFLISDNSTSVIHFETGSDLPAFLKGLSVERRVDYYCTGSEIRCTQVIHLVASSANSYAENLSALSQHQLQLHLRQEGDAALKTRKQATRLGMTECCVQDGERISRYSHLISKRDGKEAAT
ncbi:MAG: hypothetical protein LAO78_03890 [Acidobacteriia bacterium]|nr:hypothetical protein [Terriglobia bacterium]